MNPPLKGIKIVEFEGLGPGPLAGRMLVDMGAEVTVIAPPAKGAVKDRFNSPDYDALNRGKSFVTLDLKTGPGVDAALKLIAEADALIEGNRPGVMERLGLGPKECAEFNPRIVYGRMTGWGQDGPLSRVAGHDLNYVALTGMLSLSARGSTPPIVPPTVLGDGPGALGLAFGIVCAILEARSSGRGRVVDAAVIDVLAMIGSIAQWIRASGNLDSSQPSPFHDSPFYDVYVCSDGGQVTIGPLEPKFYGLLLEKLGLLDVDPARQYDVSTWPELKQRFAALFASRTRDYWCAQLEGTDVCFAPLLTPAEAAVHPHNVSRNLFEVGPRGEIVVTGAPKFLPL
jgi:alpha-methylacyl-CoA racemase